MNKLQESLEEGEEFKRLLVPPEEDRHLLTAAKWAGGYRWFRSPNVVCTLSAQPAVVVVAGVVAARRSIGAVSSFSNVRSECVVRRLHRADGSRLRGLRAVLARQQGVAGGATISTSAMHSFASLRHR
jgi:hypothetical protein